MAIYVDGNERFIVDADGDMVYVGKDEGGLVTVTLDSREVKMTTWLTPSQAEELAQLLAAVAAEEDK